MVEFSVADIIRYGGLLLTLAGLYWKMRIDVLDGRRHAEAEVKRLGDALARTDRELADQKETLRLLTSKVDSIATGVFEIRGMLSPRRARSIDETG